MSANPSGSKKTESGQAVVSFARIRMLIHKQ
jgi:hypothetical protein